MAPKDKAKATAEAAPAPQSFEEALAALQQIVEKLESGETPLAELVERYAEGERLVKVCEKHLAGFEKRLEVIREAPGKENDPPALDLFAVSAEDDA